MKKVIIIFTCILFLLGENSYSLTDKEYNNFLSSSSDFKKYDTELNDLWKILINKIPTNQKKELLNDQRYYVNKGRDIDASNVLYKDDNRDSKNITKLDRYILSTRKRLQELQNYLQYLDDGEITIEGSIIPLRSAEGGGYGICNNIYQDDKYIPVCYRIGYYGELIDNEKFNKLLNDISNNSNNKIVKISGKMDSPNSFNANTIVLNTSNIPEDVYIEIVENSDIEKLDSLIKQGYDLNAPLSTKDIDDFKVYPLTYAVSKNSIPVVKYLINHGADLNVENEVDTAGSERAITLASDKYNVTLLKLLINAGAKLSWPVPIMDNGMFDGCLCNIIENNDDELLKFALENGAMPNSSSCSGDYCRHPLAAAVEKNNINAVRILLNNGSDVNYQDPYKSSALIIAIKNNNKEIMNLLLQYGADVYKKGNDGTTLETKTPIEYAKEKNNREALSILMNHSK